ncbi:MAG: hypothetical protein CEE41_02335 [Hadesarchaea archaeon B3_Hades]|nr:MAG: hypothetical protein CEE41_02335 [Hadesarchaea archaeon B3_Hades]
MYLRYYAPDYDQESHEKIIEFLREIKERYGITCEEIPVRNKEWYKKSIKMTERKVYEKDLKPQTRVIKENDPAGETVYQKFKSRSGHIFVAGTIAVIENDRVLWGTPYKQKEFLEEVLEKGEKVFDRFKTGKRLIDIHEDFFNWLIKKNLPESGINRERKCWIREIVLGFKRLGIKKEDIKRDFDSVVYEKLEDEARKSYRKMCELKIVDDDWYKSRLQKELSLKYGFGKPLYVVRADFLITVDKRAWILEGKEKLNYESIGQVLVYKDLLLEDYPELEEIKMGIVCDEVDPILEKTCNKLNIEIFGDFGSEK